MVLMDIDIQVTFLLKGYVLKGMKIQLIGFGWASEREQGS